MKTLQKPKLPHSSGLVLTTIVLMTVALVQIFPFYWMLTFSLKSNADIYGGNIAGLPTTLHFENYVKAFTTGNIGVYLKNSVIDLRLLLSKWFGSAGMGYRRPGQQ